MRGRSNGVASSADVAALAYTQSTSVTAEGLKAVPPLSSFGSTGAFFYFVVRTDRVRSLCMLNAASR